MTNINCKKVKINICQDKKEMLEYKHDYTRKPN